MKDKKILFGIGIAFLFLASVGLSYAYFKATISGNENAEVISVGSMRLSLIYTDGKEIKGEKVSPGWEVTKTVSVENDGTEGVFFDIVWKSLDNTITNGDFQMKGNCKDKSGNYCSGITERTIEETTNGIKTGIYIPAGEKYTYDIKFAFANKNKEQNYNQSTHFYGVLNIKESTKTYTLKGTLIDNSGNAVTNTKVTIGSTEVTTNSNGEFTFDKINLGNNKLTVGTDSKDIRLVTGELASNTENELILNDDLSEGKLNITYNNNKIEKVEVLPMTLTEFMLADNTVQSDENINFAADKDGCTYDASSNTVTCPDGCTEFDGEVTCDDGKGDTNGKGLYFTSNTSLTEDNKKVYYYRGAVENNNIIFGGYCWNIVRTNEDSSVKLAFSGLATANDDGSYSCPALDGKGVIGVSRFNAKYDDNTYVGYMTGVPKTSSGDSIVAPNAINEGSNNFVSTSIEEATSNISDSTIKSFIDNWYNTYFSGNEDLLADTPYCNDRSIFNGTIGDLTTSDTSGFGNNVTLYSVMNRIVNTKIPQYKCEQNNDKFTISSINGNAKLTYPIALLTADEMMYAGSNIFGTCSNNYLKINDSYWNMSPVSFNGDVAVVAYLYRGSLNYSNVYGFYAVLPVVSLSSEATVLTGDGSYNNPYRVDSVEIKTEGVVYKRD